jgi:hypothetical protein
MATLNFPTNPAQGDIYTFAGKSWVWTGQAWRLQPQGAINGIVIGNTAPAAASFTTLSATGNITAGNASFSGNVATANIATGNAIISGNLAISGKINSSLDVNGDIIANDIEARGEIYAPGNITTSGYFVGNGRAITGIVVSGGSSIDSGNSSVSIPSDNANIFVEVNSVNVAEFTPAGLDVSGIVTAPQIVTNNIRSDDSSFVNIEDGLNVEQGLTVVGSVGVTGNVTANVVQANTFVGNISGNITAPGANTQVIFNDSGVANAVPGLQFNKIGNVLSVAGNVVSNGTFIGVGVGLTSTLVDKGSDINNWDTLVQMGVYTVNRTSWSGTQGTPLDSQVFVGLLEVKTSLNQTTVQIFSPGTVDVSDIKIQWNRNLWNGSWTPWVRMTNDGQLISGGEF